MSDLHAGNHPLDQFEVKRLTANGGREFVVVQFRNWTGDERFHLYLNPEYAERLAVALTTKGSNE